MNWAPFIMLLIITFPVGFLAFYLGARAYLKRKGAWYEAE